MACELLSSHRVKLCIALVLSLAATAVHAQPALTPPTPAPPTFYVAPGLVVGGDGANDAVFGALSLEGGYRFSPSWWAHAGGWLGGGNNAAWGRAATIHPTNDQLRFGVDWHHGLMFVGVAAAIVHEYVKNQPDQSYDGGAGVLRAGLDLGGEHLRLRPDFSLAIGGKLHGQPAIGGKDYESAAVSLAIAYTW